MTFQIYLCVVLVATSAVLVENKLHPLSDEFIDAINKDQTSWKAGRNFPLNTSITYLQSLMGQLPENTSETLQARPFHPSRLEDIPEQFDARNEWPFCLSLRQIRDQSECSSCWAVSTTSAMTDRICIQSNGTNTSPVSAANLLSCFPGCGCNGGFSAKAWLYWVYNGIATGSNDYGSTEGCINYPFPPCNHGVERSSKPVCGDERPTPSCQRYCDYNTQLGVKSKYLTFGKVAYRLTTESEIQEDVLKNGPVTGVFSVYQDFCSYKKGVYHYTRGKLLGLHAVRIIGWGIEDSTPYWLISNSWNEDWGDNGYFKIRRGTNECGIESGVAAGQPDLNFPH